MSKLKVVFLVLFLVALAGFGYAELSTTGDKVPDSVGITIRNVQHDEDAVRQQETALRAQFQLDEIQIANDEKLIDNAKAEAFKAAHRDPAKTDINVETLQFVNKADLSKVKPYTAPAQTPVKNPNPVVNVPAK